MKYPIYIISNGRAVNHFTPKYLMIENMTLPAVRTTSNIKIIVRQYQEICSKITIATLGLGSFLSHRNWCWEDFY
jgi:hypothetical protein